MKNPLYSTEQAAKLLGVTPRTMIYRRQMRLPPTFIKIGHYVRYRASDIDQFINSNAVMPLEEASS